MHSLYRLSASALETTDSLPGCFCAQGGLAEVGLVRFTADGASAVAELVVFAYHFARRLGNHAFVDVFLFCVMPHAIDRSLDAKRDPSGCETTRYG